MLERNHHLVSNGDGWRLVLKQTVDEEHLDRARRPVLLVPGYGMNAFLFGYHPEGLSLEDYLARDGFEVWSVNLRGQGGSTPEGSTRPYGMAELSLVDLPATVDFVRVTRRGHADRVDLVGCSLGGTLVYAYAALFGEENIGSIAALGAPLRWENVHPALKLAFSSPALIGALRIKGSRTMAAMALPLLKKAPWLLSMYLHPEIVDLSRPDMLARTVEDPRPELNREIAVWMREKDLTLRGRNLTESFRCVTRPLLCMLANADGIVPPKTALSAYDACGAETKDFLTVGTDRIKLAHADLFISRHSQELVFEPLASWLKKQS